MSNEPERQHPKEDEMSEPIGVGDWVECVDAGPDAAGDPVPLQVGAIYQVASIGLGADARGEVGECIVIEGLANGKLDLKARVYWMDAYDVSRFRPVFRPSQSLFLTQLLEAPADPEQVTA